jgi:hypothetical protein
VCVETVKKANGRGRVAPVESPGGWAARHTTASTPAAGCVNSASEHTEIGFHGMRRSIRDNSIVSFNGMFPHQRGRAHGICQAHEGKDRHAAITSREEKGMVALPMDCSSPVSSQSLTWPSRTRLSTIYTHNHLLYWTPKSRRVNCFVDVTFTPTPAVGQASAPISGSVPSMRNADSILTANNTSSLEKVLTSDICTC